jgi:PTH1 family peptidyl-tRNA hydrolase
MFLFAGLGNPGAKYARNRHNIGFMAVDEIVRRHHFSPWRKKFQSEVSDGVIDGEKVLVLKPQTYMNESGRAVGEAVRFHNIPLTQVYVFYDELDLLPGKMRVKLGGGAAGHNGIRSIAAHLGPDFKRVRLGIGHPGVKDFVMPHVLGDFAKVDGEWLPKLLEAVAAEIELVVSGEDEKFQSRVALALKPPRPNADPSSRRKPGPTDEAEH